VSGFSEGRWSTVQQIKGVTTCSATSPGVSRSIGVLEVTGVAYQDKSPTASIWRGSRSKSWRLSDLKPDFLQDISESCEAESE
jgi:hypothetical protein